MGPPCWIKGRSAGVPSRSKPRVLGDASEPPRRDCIPGHAAAGTAALRHQLRGLQGQALIAHLGRRRSQVEFESPGRWRLGLA
jgi:hypothetical protein